MAAIPEKTAIVTGAARGIGRATALALAKRGFAVALVDRLASELDATAKDAAALGVPVLPLPGNVADYEATQAQGRAVLDAWGHVDVLVNNAGISQPKGLLEISEAEWDEIDRDQSQRTVQLVQGSGAEHGRGQRRPDREHLVGQRAHRRRVHRGQPLRLLRGQGRRARAHPRAREGARAQGRRSTRSAPEPWSRRSRRSSSADHHDVILGTIPLARLGQPEDIAEVVAFLATVTPMFITGEVIDVDGGQWVN